MICATTAAVYVNVLNDAIAAPRTCSVFLVRTEYTTTTQRTAAAYDMRLLLILILLSYFSIIVLPVPNFRMHV